MSVDQVKRKIFENLSKSKQVKELIEEKVYEFREKKISDLLAEQPKLAESFYQELAAYKKALVKQLVDESYEEYRRHHGAVLDIDFDDVFKEGSGPTPKVDSILIQKKKKQSSNDEWSDDEGEEEKSMLSKKELAALFSK